jgi:hypothetical protein
MGKFCGLIKNAMQELHTKEQIEKSKFLKEYIENELKTIQDLIKRENEQVDVVQELKGVDKFQEAMRDAKALELNLDYNRKQLASIREQMGFKREQNQY